VPPPPLTTLPAARPSSNLPGAVEFVSRLEYGLDDELPRRCDDSAAVVGPLAYDGDEK